MRVLLVSANREHIPDPIFPLGLACIATATQQAGYQVAVADLCFGNQPIHKLQQQIRSFKPDVIGLSLRNVDNAAYPLTVDYLTQHREVIDTIRDITPATVVLGGSGFSILPEAYMQVLDADYGIKGEGEQAFVTLLGALDHNHAPGMVPGVLARKHNHSSGIDIKIPVKNDTNPGNGLRPARHLFDYARYVAAYLNATIAPTRYSKATGSGCAMPVTSLMKSRNCCSNMAHTPSSLLIPS
jgi:hypothetical protein